MTRLSQRPEKPGRNEPCPCGSGRLYKHCCKPTRRERRQRHRRRLVAAASRTAPAEVGQAPTDQIRRMAAELMPGLSPDQAQELERLLEAAEDLTAYEVMQDEVEAASQTLEDHRAEFEALFDDLHGIADRTHLLFSEDPFHRMRYTPADVHRAFEAIGYPRRHQDEPQKAYETMVNAMLYLADEEQRLYLTRRLMMMLPEYVSAGRYLDAWLIQYCAFQMLEASDQTNPFLYEMFLYGLGEWAEQVEAQQEALLGELGIDESEVAGMTFEEMDAWFQEALDDPARIARLEAYYATHQLLSDQAEAQSREMERATLQLLEREDADRLLLSSEELNPWIPDLVERLASFGAQATRALERDEDVVSVLQKDIGKELVNLSVEMASQIFTPARLDRLVAELQAYRRDLQQAGEQHTALYAHAASMRLAQEKVPSDYPLLIGICFASLRAVLIAQAGANNLEAE